MKDFLLNHIFVIVSTLFGGGSLVGWIMERNKRKSEERQMAADALKTMQEAYDGFTKDSLDRYSILREEYEALREQSIQLKLEVTELKNKLEAVHKLAIQEKIRHKVLQKEFEDYKKKYPEKDL